MAVNFKIVEHLISKQAQKETKMLKQLEEGNYTLENPLVELNPYFISPLTALVMFETEEEVAVTVTVKGKDYEELRGLCEPMTPADISHTFEKGKKHIIPVLGLYVSYDNKVVITLSNGLEKELTIATGAHPSNVCECTYINTADTYMQDNIMFLSQTEEYLTAGYDYQGDIRWYATETFVFDLKRAQNGNILIGGYRFIAPPYYMSGICEMSLTGKLYAEYRVPGGYHHDQFEMEDGNILIATQNAGANKVEDVCVLVDRTTGEILKTWDYKDVLPTDVAGSGSQDSHDWFHNNAVWYDKNTNSITLSGRHQDAIINIDYESGALNWILGDPEGWPQDMVDQYFFKIVGDGDFDWQYEQHAALMTPGGDVMCFDNGHWRAKKKENYRLGKDNFSRGVRYKIDTENMTIEQVWQYGKERGSLFFSPYICNVEYYAEGHYLVHSGGTGFYHRKPTESIGSMIIEGSGAKHAKLNSITVELKDDKVMYEMHVNGNFYRAEKLPLYHDGENLAMGEGKLLGHMAQTEQMETEVPADNAGILVPDEYEASFIKEEDRLQFKGKFIAGQLVMLELHNLYSDAILKYFVPTTKNNFLAMCVGTFQESDDRAVTYNINDEGISGKYEIKLIIDNDKYETGVVVAF